VALKSSILQSLRGYVLLQLRGEHPERLINKLVENRMMVWDIRYLGDSNAQLFISLKDYFRLRPLLKQTGCKMHVLRRYGFPFILDKLEKRKFFAIGLLGFIIGIFILSSVIWQVKVQGNQQISTMDILQAAKQEGIYKLQWKYRLKNTDLLSKSLQGKLPGTAWVGVEIHGTQIVINVVEAVIPEKPLLLNPRHLVASNNALITSIFAEKGRPVVKPNTYVRKGDILISGILGDELHQQTVAAAGRVKGIVWYTPKIEVPLMRQFKIYTGEVTTRSYLVIGNRGLQLNGYGKITYNQYETLSERKIVQWRDYTLPIGWIRERIVESNMIEQPLEPAEARELGLGQAKAEIMAAAGEGARIVTEKILHEKTENGKVYMEVHFEVEESIAEEQPIVP
jgi:similar to stage IV sporulation protein